MNSKQKGNLTELRTMLAFVERGFNVLIPYGEVERYDFVVDANGKFYKIQCKTASTENNGNTLRISCRSSNRKNGKVVHQQYSKEEIDYFVTCFADKCYVIPVDDCGSDKRLRLTPTKNSQKKGVCWAKDYEIDEIINKW